jgi:hypothetical protein
MTTEKRRRTARIAAPAKTMADYAMSFERLGLWIGERARSATLRHPQATSLSMLDGAVASVVAGPVSMMPEEWVCPLPIRARAKRRGGPAGLVHGLLCGHQAAAARVVPVDEPERYRARTAAADTVPMRRPFRPPGSRRPPAPSGCSVVRSRAVARHSDRR